MPAPQVKLVEVVVQHGTEVLQAVPRVGHRHPLGQGVGESVGVTEPFPLDDLDGCVRRAGLPVDADLGEGPHVAARCLVRCRWRRRSRFPAAQGR